MRTSAEAAVHILGYASALVPATAVVVVPLWAVSRNAEAIIDAPFWWSIAAWALTGSLVVFKFVPPLLTAIAWPNERVGILLPFTWAAAVAASSIVVVALGVEHVPHLAQLRSTNFTAMAALWVCVEIVGTIALPALVVPPRWPPMLDPIDDERIDPRPIVGPKPAALSADLPPPIGGDEVLSWLRDVAANPAHGRTHGITVEPDGSLRTSHRQLAAALQLTKSNCVRRLARLAREEKIKIDSTREGSRIRIVDRADDRLDRQPTGSPLSADHRSPD